MTKDEINEYKKCAKDIIYFVNKYCKLLTPKGIKNITLHDYQKEQLKRLFKKRLET